ncbi:MAG: hypothetical protein ACOX7K_01670 [Oscillospiraceae bacterium]|jgi:hypothetical protein
MSLEAIRMISEAEAQAECMKADAAAEAKQAVEEAERAGKALVEAALRKADAELQALGRKVDEAAAIETGNSQEDVTTKEAVVRVHAESKMDEAAQWILERIVGG